MSATCSWRLARRTWPTLPAYGLSYLSRELGLALDHHEAGSDAAASAGVMLAAIRELGASSLDDMFDRLGMRPGTLTPDSFVGVSAHGGNLRNMLGGKDADPGHPLYGRYICFTGAMFSMTRGEAAERIVEFGAEFKTNVSKHVDMLVIGDADFVRFADGMQTGKMKKAAALREDGFEIEIMAERDSRAPQLVTGESARQNDSPECIAARSSRSSIPSGRWTSRSVLNVGPPAGERPLECLRTPNTRVILMSGSGRKSKPARSTDRAEGPGSRCR